MPKHVLKSLDLTTLLVALDHLEEYEPSKPPPDPYITPGECVYLAYMGKEQTAALAARLPHFNVVFRSPGGRVVRKVYNKASVLHILEFAFPRDEAYKKFIRNLQTINPKYWGVLDANGKLIRRKPQKRKKGEN